MFNLIKWQCEGSLWDVQWAQLFDNLSINFNPD